MSFYVEAIESGRLPGSILDDISCKFNEGSLLCEVRIFEMLDATSYCNAMLSLFSINNCQHGYAGCASTQCYIIERNGNRLQVSGRAAFLVSLSVLDVSSFTIFS